MDNYERNTKKVMQKFGIKIHKRLMGMHINKDWDESDYRNKYNITVMRGDKKITFIFWDSINNTQKGDTPSDYDIIATIKSEAFCPEDFKCFCDEFGYDTDSKKADSLFVACRKMSEKIMYIFTEEEIEQLPD